MVRVGTVILALLLIAPAADAFAIWPFVSDEEEAIDYCNRTGFELADDLKGRVSNAQLCSCVGPHFAGWAKQTGRTVSEATSDRSFLVEYMGRSLALCYSRFRRELN